jgi:hypothetical protein
MAKLIDNEKSKKKKKKKKQRKREKEVKLIPRNGFVSETNSLLQQI